MAAKKPKAPKKFKQARKAAVADAKGAFANGKTKAVRRDPLAKVSAEDKAVLSEVKKEAKGNYITDDRGNKVFQKPTETAQERMLRDRREAKAAVDRMYEAEDAKEKKAVKKAPAKATAPAKAEAPAKPKTKKVGKNFGKYGATDEYKIEKGLEKEAKTAKPKVNKPATKGYAAGKTLNATGQARYDELIKQGVKPKSAMNKALFAQEKATKPSTPKMSKAEVKTQVKTALDKLPGQNAPAKSSTPKYVQSTRTNAPTTSKELVVRPKTSTEVVGKTETAAAGKKSSKLKKIGKFGAVTAAAAAAFDAKNMIEGSKRKAQAEADLFYEQKGRNRNPIERAGAAIGSLPTSAKQLARYASMGLVGEDVGKAADRAEKKLAKYKQAKTAKANKGLRYGKDGSSLVPGTDAYKKGSKTRPTNPVAPGAGKGTTPGAGGSTSTTYVVKRGDNLSKIAKNNNVKLSELLAANTKFKTDAKYKGGSMIWAGTKVKLPKK